MISIEICSNNKTGKITTPNDPNYYFTDAAVKNAVELTKLLMKMYNIDEDHVIRHYDVNGKPCPGIIGWNAESGDETKWNAFKKALLEEEKPKNNIGLKYCAHVQGKGWLPVVHDGLTAGTTGESRRLEAIKIDTSAIEGLTLTVHAHIQGEGWKTFENITKDTIIGTVGEGKRLECIAIVADGLPDGKNLYYQVHAQSIGWMDVVKAPYATGTLNQSLRLEGIKIYIE